MAAMAVGAEDAKKLQLIEDLTKDVDSVQGRVLAEILARNAGTEYLRGCSGPTDRATFRAMVPVVSYDALKPYIQRIANGDTSPVLSAHPVTDFFTSSGTSGGEPKLIPNIDDEGGRRQLIVGLLTAVINLHFPGVDKGKGLYFMFVKPETKTAGGLTAWPALTSVYKSEKFKPALEKYYTSPRAAVLCADAFQSMYAQMVCGLCLRHDVLRIGTVFAASLLRAIRFLQLNWEQLADDIEAGALSPRVTDSSVREAVAGILRRPDPELGRLIRQECCKGGWAGIVTRIWPNTRYDVVTGAMAQYVPALEHYGGGLPMVSNSYASSECYFGINLRPLCDPSEVSYTIMPNTAYFEFLPLDKEATGEADTSQLVDPARVEAGREEFLSKRTTCRVELPKETTCESNCRIRPPAATSAGGRPGGWGLPPPALAAGRNPRRRVAGDMIPGGNGTGTGLVGPAATVSGGRTVRVVRPGTFGKLMDQAISRGASINQYKAPRCVTLPAIIELLDSRVVSSHISPTPPHWTPGRRYD